LKSYDSLVERYPEHVYETYVDGYDVPSSDAVRYRMNEINTFVPHKAILTGTAVLYEFADSSAVATSSALPKGTQPEIQYQHKEKTDWFKAKVNNKFGWIHAKSFRPIAAVE
jgi:hypothetical protein